MVVTSIREDRRPGLVKKKVQVKGRDGKEYESTRWVKQVSDAAISVLGIAAVMGVGALAIVAANRGKDEEIGVSKNPPSYPMPVSKSASESGYGAVLQEVNEKIRNLDFEVGCGIHPETGEVLFSRKGDERSVKFSEEDIRIARKANGVIFTHNHPGGNPFSSTDMKLGAMVGAREIWAVGKEYDYSIRPKYGVWSTKTVVATADRLYKEAIGRHYNRILREINPSDPMAIKEANLEVMHRAAEDTAVSLGLEYRRIPKTRIDSLPSIAQPLPVIPDAKRKLARLMTVLLNRVYTDGIDRILSINVDSNLLVSGTFQDEDTLIDFWFDLPDEKLWYKRTERKMDSYLEVFQARLDKGASRKVGTPRKPRKCNTGLNCGGSCIDPDETCRIGDVSRTLASKQEMNVIKSVAKQVAPASPAQPKDDLDGKSIRKLRAIASSTGVVKYSRMNVEELKQAIRVARLNPQSQENIRKTLANKAEARRVIKQSTPQGFAAAWDGLQKIMKAANVSPEMAALLAGAFIIGKTVEGIQATKDRYKSNLEESANMAHQRAQGVPVVSTNKPNIMFAVGGFSGIGSTGERMKEVLEEPGDGSERDRWLGDENEIVTFNHKEFDIPAPDMPKRNEDGSYSSSYLGYVTWNGFGKFMENLQRGRNEAAVDLAANLYAYGAKYPKADINVLGHGVGGNIASEAVEILHRMRSPDGEGPSGLDVSKRLNIVNLGTPYFGFTDDKIWSTIRHRTITSPSDPFSGLPKKNAQWISSVNGGEVDDYLSNGEVKERLREAFGYYSSSIRGGARKPAGPNPDMDLAGFGSGPKMWKSMSRATTLYKTKPEDAALTSSAAVYGESKKAYSDAVQKYRSNIKNAASEAVRISSEEINVPATRKPNSMLVIGGTGASSKDAIEAIAKGSRTDPNLKWMTENNQIEGFDPVGIPQLGKGSLATNPGGVLRAVYSPTIGRVLGEGVNNDAVRLAATLHAYGTKEQPAGRAGKRTTPINVLALGNGGNTAREAIDILREMPGGKEVADRLKLVTTGTPSFTGMASDSTNEAQLVGDGDEIANLPFFQKGSGKARRVTGVRSHDPLDYLASKDATRQATDAFKGKVETPERKPRAYAWETRALASKDPENPLNRPEWKTLPEEEQKRLRENYLEKVRSQRELEADQRLVERKLKEFAKRRKAEDNAAKKAKPASVPPPPPPQGKSRRRNPGGSKGLINDESTSPTQDPLPKGKPRRKASYPVEPPPPPPQGRTRRRNPGGSKGLIPEDERGD